MAANSAEKPGPSLEPVYNERGVIAESYHDLQGLGALAAARAAYPLPKSSPESTLRAVFQSADIALVNLAEILGRTATDLENGALGRAMVKMTWVRGFHRVLTRLGIIAGQLTAAAGGERPRGVLRIAESPAYAGFAERLRHLDAVVRRCIDSGVLGLRDVVADRSLDDVALHLVHLIRISNHEITIWEQDLAEVPVPVEVPSYAAFVVSAGMRDAVFEREIQGDTFFTQFRGLHQIPETLGEEVNDHTEQAIRDLRTGHLRQAVEHLACGNRLLEGVVAALPPMADSLTASDYHDIRENLGLTSGSHSVCLRFDMFTDLYQQLAGALVHRLTGGEGTDEEIRAEVQRIDAARFDDPEAWLLHQVVNECLSLRTYIFNWRDQHVHMPRNNLGGGSTKSLTGAPDALTAVRRMRDAAREKDPLRPVLRARGRGGELPPRELAAYFDGPESVDSRILVTTGEVTQRRFQEVQERLGFFSRRCPFSPPPRREVV